MRPIAAFAILMITTACGGTATDPKAESPTAATVDPTTAPEPTPNAPPRTRDPLLFLSGRADVVVLDTQDGKQTMRAVGGMASPDRTAVAQVVGRRLVVIDPATGEPQWEHSIPAERRVRVVAPGARQVALVDGRILTPSDARSTTQLTIVDEHGSRELALDGNFDPEAFTLDGTDLVAVEYLPATNPDHYEVRLVDLATGRVRPVPDQPEHFPANAPRPRMRGYARTQVSSSDGRYLYTYYSSDVPINEDHGDMYAFVHVLDLHHEEAYCIDLAQPFGVGADGWSEPALTLTPDGSRLLVTDRVTGALAAIDPRTLEVTATATLPKHTPLETSAVATASDDVLYLALDRELTRIDTTTLQIIDRIDVDDPITGIKMDRTGELLYAVTFEDVSLFDPAGAKIASWPLPIPGAGADPSVARPGSGAYQCAC
jgi:hypothetical protein